MKCIKCGDTGILLDGSKCDCGAGDVKIPIAKTVPTQYAESLFDKSLLPLGTSDFYGVGLERVIKTIEAVGTFNKNLLVCSKVGMGKTVFAYSVYSIMLAKGKPIADVMDLIEARELLLSTSFDQSVIDRKELLIKAPIAVIKIPNDLPNRYADTILTINERRVRNNGVTIYLSNLSSDTLLQLDKSGTFKSILKDGSYSTLSLLEES